MTKTSTSSSRWTTFCNLWISVGSSATVDHNRLVSAAGHAATMRALGL